VAGPIERPQNLLHQLRERHSFDYDRVTDGLKLMVVGFFKKVVVADRLAMLVNPVYGHPREHAGPALLIATVLFAFQIYADFSGYSDIAIGCARVMGIDLMTNFRRPYLATSVAEFWQRWHISLSTWFRDYLYIPLGGNRVGMARWQLNLLITFLLSGLWHGANWTFVVWGGLNGVYLIVETWLGRVGDVRLGTALRRLLVFALIDVSWIFFRADNLSDAWYILTHLGSLHGGVGLGAAFAVGRRDLLLAFAALAALLAFDAATERCPDWLSWIRRRSAWQRWALYQAAVAGVVFLGHYGGAQFIYFQF
jgi:D-alanyl-lipoteichoic acid acyltransferase DltB (MBOAT superfamily)